MVGSRRKLFFPSTLALAGALWFGLGLGAPGPASGQMEETTRRGADEGAGPYNRMIIRGVTIIDGTGAPPQGPIDIVVEGDRIAEVRSVGSPGVPIQERASVTIAARCESCRKRFAAKDNLAGRKPEGLSLSTRPGYLALTFDADADAPSWLELPWPR